MSNPAGERAPLVMLVEDDLAVGQMYQVGLECSGFRVAVLTNESEFFRAIDAEIPDAAVLDFQLHGLMTGVDIIDNLRLDHRTADLPVFVLSNDLAALDAQMNRALEAGAIAWLVKSDTNPTQLAGRINQALCSRPVSDPGARRATQTRNCWWIPLTRP